MDKAVETIREKQREAQCNNHELSEQVTEHKFKCPSCGVTKDIRSLGSDKRSMSAASTMEYAR